MVQYTYSSHRTRHLEKIRKQRQKYPDIARKIINTSDIILEVLDARFFQETRNIELEKEILNQKKQIIYVFNKSDLIKNSRLKEIKDTLYPYAIISCTKRLGIKDLRNLIKRLAKKIENPEKREIRKNKIVIGEDNRIKVGVIGYPNTGKSSLINLLSGKSSAGVGADAGFTKNIQKIKLSENLILIDSPGVIPEEHYSTINKKMISSSTITGGKSYTQVKEPELVISEIMLKFPGILQKFYSVNVENSEELIENVGRKKGFLKKENKVDEDKTARTILKEWQLGKIKI